MLEWIYNIVANLEFILIVMMVAKYVFLEAPGWKYDRWFFGICFALLCVTNIFLSEDIWMALFLMMLPGIYIFLSRKKKKIRGFFLGAPLFGIIFGLYMPGEVILSLFFSEKVVEVYVAVIDVISGIVMIVFLWRGKQWRQRFLQELEYRTLKKWEKRLLIWGGWLLLIVFMPLVDEPVVQQLDSNIKEFVVMASILIFIMTIVMIVVIHRGNRMSYYEGIAGLNERYLAMELQHFKTYQLTQQETRRIHHDMKHHFACLNHLSRQGDMKGIQDYLKDIGATLETVESEVHCGNVLADAICTQKYQVAKQKGITFEITGRMPEQVVLEPVDLCTILSNALDNAIEAVENMVECHRWIRFEISSQGNMLFFHFLNPMKDDGKEFAIGKTTKQQPIYHGFGLQNIRHVVEKYHGQMQIEIDRQVIPQFSLSIVVGEG